MTTAKMTRDTTSKPSSAPLTSGFKHYVQKNLRGGGGGGGGGKWDN